MNATQMTYGAIQLPDALWAQLPPGSQSAITTHNNTLGGASTQANMHTQLSRPSQQSNKRQHWATFIHTFGLCSVFGVRCADVRCAMCDVRCAMGAVQCAMCDVRWGLCDVQCAMGVVRWGLWAVGCGLWAVGCGLWAVGCENIKSFTTKATDTTIKKRTSPSSCL